MKKLLTLIIILGAAFFYATRDSAPEEPVTKQDDTATTFQPSALNTTFTIDDEEIMLKEGKADNITLLETAASGDLNNDNKIDTVVLLAHSPGGSGVFIYVAAYVSGSLGYKGSNALFLGDRIAPQSISISKGMVTIRYLDRQEDEPFAAEPTVPSAKEFAYRNGEFVER